MFFQRIHTLLNLFDEFPCDDIGMNSEEKLKVNMKTLLNKRFPSPSTWIDVGWHGKSIEFIIDSIIKEKFRSVEKFKCYAPQ